MTNQQNQKQTPTEKSQSNYQLRITNDKLRIKEADEKQISCNLRIKINTIKIERKFNTTKKLQFCHKDC